MGKFLLLESFDTFASQDPVEAVEPEAPPLSYEDGYRTGFAAGLAQARDDGALLEEDLCRSFAELSLTQEQARENVLVSLRPLFLTLAETLLPETARASLGPYVAEVLAEAAETDSRAPISLLVAPEVVDLIAAVVDRTSENPVFVEANPGLGPGEVLIRSAERETMLDLDALLEEIRAALAAIFGEDIRRTRNG